MAWISRRLLTPSVEHSSLCFNMNEQEIWKDVKGFEGDYVISNLGRLGSLKCGFNVLSNVNKKGGYLSVVLRGKNKIRYARIHRLVYEAFVGEIPSGHKNHIHHINHDKQDNRVSNLTLLTSAEHYKADIDSRNVKGMNDYNRYVRPKTIHQYTTSGEFVNSYNNAKEASDATGVCQRNILQVANKTPYNKDGAVRKQAGGFVWKFADC